MIGPRGLFYGGYDQLAANCLQLNVKGRVDGSGVRCCCIGSPARVDKGVPQAPHKGPLCDG